MNFISLQNGNQYNQNMHNPEFIQQIFIQQQQQQYQAQQQMSQQQYQQPYQDNNQGSQYISMNTQQNNIIVEEEEQQQNENVMYSEIEQRGEDQDSFGRINTAVDVSQIHSQNQFDGVPNNFKQYQQNSGTAQTLNLGYYPYRTVQSCKTLEEKKADHNKLSSSTQKRTKMNSEKDQMNYNNYQFNSAQDLILNQNSITQREEKQENSDEERKGEKRLSPIKNNKAKKEEMLLYQIKTNSSCQLSEHSQQSASSSSSSSNITSLSSSSSSSLKNLNEDQNNEDGTNKSDYILKLVPITKFIWSKESVAAFGDCHVELSIERDSPADNRFQSFQYWRPCSQYTIDQTSQIARFFCEPNFSSRTSDFNSCISIYKNYPDQTIKRWGHVLEVYQQWTSILYNEADFFFKKLNANPSLKKYFEEKMDLFMEEAMKKVNSLLLDENGGSKKNLFSYSLRKLNEQYNDIGSIQYGYSRGLIDIFGPDPQETRLYLQRYGLNYFFDQKTRIERYIHDFQYIQQGGQIYDSVNIITLDKIQLQLKVSNQYIYYDFFQDPRAQEVFGDFSECARLVRKFAGCKIEIFELEPIQQQKLQVERQIYKPIYEKEKLLTFDQQLLSLYYKNEVKKFKNFKPDNNNNNKQNKNYHTINNDEDQQQQLFEDHTNIQFQDNNFEQFGDHFNNNNIFANYNQVEKKEEEHFQNFQFDLCSDQTKQY